MFHCNITIKEKKSKHYLKFLTLKEFIKTLVANSGHKKILTDEELTETIFCMIEGGSVAASIFKNTDDLRSAKQTIHKLI